jgi:hypothetical protein
LDLKVVTRTRIQGVLKRGSIGLRFDSQKTSKDFYYLVTTLDDKVIATARSEGGVITSSMGKNVRAIFEKSDLKSFDALAGSLKAIQSTKAKRRRARYSADAEKVISAIKIDGDIKALRAVIEMPEYALLPVLSDQLAQAGMIGNLYRPSFALHALGMAAKSMLADEPAGKSRILARQILPPRIRPNISGKIGDLLAPPNVFGFCWNREDGPNLEQLPPCPADFNACGLGSGRGGPADDPENACFGRCGDGCECWESLCGDCCFNQKCASHDSVRRNCSWNPLTWASCAVAANPAWLLPFGCS